MVWQHSLASFKRRSKGGGPLDESAPWARTGPMCKLHGTACTAVLNTTISGQATGSDLPRAAVARRRGSLRRGQVQGRRVVANTCRKSPRNIEHGVAMQPHTQHRTWRSHHVEVCMQESTVQKKIDDDGQSDFWHTRRLFVYCGVISRHPRDAVTVVAMC